jgi:hypothetical protein
MWLGRYTSEMEETKSHMTEARIIGKKKVKTRKSGKNKVREGTVTIPDEQTEEERIRRE